MSEEHVQFAQIATQLSDARDSVSTIADFSPLDTGTLDDGYAVQKEWIKLQATKGYKVSGYNITNSFIGRII